MMKKVRNKSKCHKQNEKTLHFEEEQVYVAKITNIIMPNDTKDYEKNHSISDCIIIFVIDGIYKYYRTCCR